MAYFPNGTAGMMYEDRWCSRCKNRRDKGDGRGAGCAIWDVHLLYTYEEAGNTKRDEATGKYEPTSNARAMLDYLIPEDDEGFPAECSMFMEKSKEELEAEQAIDAAISNRNLGYSVMPCMAAWAKERGIVP